MSSSQDTETKHAAIEKAREGARLLSDGDYQGAIAACTEAIRLDPRFDDAYLLRSEAYGISNRPSPLRLISSPLVFIWETLVFILGGLWWTIFDAADAMDRAHGIEHSTPPPRFREQVSFLYRHDQSKLAWGRVAALLETDILKEAPSVDTRSHRLATPIPKKREWMEAQCLALRNLGIDAHVQEHVGRIQLLEGPISWITVFEGGDYSTSSCWVPDSRIREGYRHVSAYPRRWSSFPWFGRPKQVWWGSQDPDLKYEYPDGLIDEKFSLWAAKWLTQNSAVTEGILAIDESCDSLSIQTDQSQGCWEIFLGLPKEFTLPMWSCCRAVAEALLAMPMPSED